VCGACGTHGRGAINTSEGLINGAVRKNPPGRPRHRWENNVKIDHKQIGWEGMGWIHAAQDRNKCWAVVKTKMRLQVP
jgi:hypothetical protein